jgi:hypothetical protein
MPSLPLWSTPSSRVHPSRNRTGRTVLTRRRPRPCAWPLRRSEPRPTLSLARTSSASSDAVPNGAEAKHTAEGAGASGPSGCVSCCPDETSARPHADTCGSAHLGAAGWLRHLAVGGGAIQPLQGEHSRTCRHGGGLTFRPDSTIRSISPRRFHAERIAATASVRCCVSCCPDETSARPHADTCGSMSPFASACGPSEPWNAS